MYKSRVVAAVAVTCWLVTVLVAPAAASSQGTPPLERLAEFVETRSLLNLPDDPSFVADLLLTGEGSAGFDSYGIPLTPDEVAVLDARVAKQAASSAFVHAARSVEGFAGAYYDHRRDGALVLMLVDPTPSTVEAIRAMFPQMRES